MGEPEEVKKFRDDLQAFMREHNIEVYHFIGKIGKHQIGDGNMDAQTLTGCIMNTLRFNPDWRLASLEFAAYILKVVPSLPMDPSKFDIPGGDSRGDGTVH